MELIAILAGFLCGILSGLGVGGGSLLMVYLSLWLKLPPQEAAGINLLYFIPSALGANLAHRKEGLLHKGAIVPAAVVGCIMAVLGVLLAAKLDQAALRPLLGAFVCLLGLRELVSAFTKKK